MSITPADNSKDLAMDVQALGRLRQSARQNSPLALKESARQFEALFLGTMVKSMRDASAPKVSASSPKKTRRGRPRRVCAFARAP